MAEDDDFVLSDEQAARLRELLDADNEDTMNNEEAVIFSDDEELEPPNERRLRKNRRTDFNDVDSSAMDEDLNDEDYEESEDEGSAKDGEELDDENSNIASERDSEDLNEGEFEFSDEEDEQLSESDIDEEFEFINALREASNFKTKKRKEAKKPKKKGGLAALRRKIRREEPSPEVKILLGKANEAFVRNELDKASNFYLEVVKMDKMNFSAYKTLGEIARLKGDYNRCSNFWLLAAHIHQWDYEFWRELAELSVELGHQRQAVYCYTKAIKSSHHKDYESIFARACIYREQRRFKRATDSLLKLRTVLPKEPKIVRELAKVYVDEDRVNDAITMYKKILEDNMSFRRLRQKRRSRSKLKSVPFGWSELNILSELYSNKGAWSLGIKMIRQVARWIEEREDQTFWDNKPDTDIEFDERRFDFPKFQNLKIDEKKKDYALPIDIRVQLGLFRLNTKNTTESMKHFNFLLNQPIEDTTDLYLKVGMELEGFGLYGEALELLIPISYIEEQNTPSLVLAIAKCLRETGDFENAKEAYMRLLEYNPEDVEIKVALAEVCFYLNDMDTTSRLYKEAKEQRTKERASARSNLLANDTAREHNEEGEEEVEEEEEEEEDNYENDDGIFSKNNQALIADLPQKKPNKKKKLTFSAAELKNRVAKSELRVTKQYKRIMRLLENLHNQESTEVVGCDERTGLVPGPGEKNLHIKAIASLWIDLTSDLIEIFSMYRCFFSSERAKGFNVGLRKRTEKLSIDHKLSRMRYLQNEIILSEEMDSAEDAVKQTSFRGITYEQWYNLFMKYAIMIAQYEQDTESSMAILDIAKHVNVFKDYNLTTTLVGLSIGIQSSDHYLAQTQVRNLMNDYQFCPIVLKIFMASYLPDSFNMEHYADPSTQKYILRQVKAYDSLKEKKDITGMAAITNKNVDLSTNHPLLNYIYASLLYFNKSYYSALAYCVKLYRNFDNDPALLFLLALSNLNRSTQRKTLNTNFQILQGLTYLKEYAELKDMNDPYQKMEVLYNVGRAFHQLGLDNIAISFYEKVLKIEVDDDKYDLKIETAYNLYMIYNIHQNFQLAEDIMDMYLVV